MFVPSTRDILDALPNRNSDDYEAATVTPEKMSYGDALRTNQKITGTAIPLKEAR